MCCLFTYFISVFICHNIITNEHTENPLNKISDFVFKQKIYMQILCQLKITKSLLNNKSTQPIWRNVCGTFIDNFFVLGNHHTKNMYSNFLLAIEIPGTTMVFGKRWG